MLVYLRINEIKILDSLNPNFGNLCPYECEITKGFLNCVVRSIDFGKRKSSGDMICNEGIYICLSSLWNIECLI